MTARVPLEDWAAAAVEATLEMTGATLGFEGVAGGPNSGPGNLPGAYIGLMAPSEVVQVGLVAEMSGLQTLAKSMMGMAPEDEDLPSTDVADAIGEIANIFAGGIKKRMLPRLGSVSLGLPLFINGHIEPTEKLIIHAVDLQLGPVATSLLVIRERETAR